MGVALPGNGTVLAMTPERIEMVKVAAKRIVEMTLDKNSEKWNMRNILNDKAIHNAFVIDMAMGGSSNTVLHLLSIAKEAEVDFEYYIKSMRYRKKWRISPKYLHRFQRYIWMILTVQAV